ncbi:hypothetical protein T4D_4084 [Trichinella pseudospiralis]|uniref:Uncharacterized protein n=1 Tax=Trichinella pseudospiralis TaxID=6337 RepID=A0A0V1FDS0_TRIPS|nr:hypothetical protein T4D_4084 [Trichinella pseudospiralis]
MKRPIKRRSSESSNPQKFSIWCNFYEVMMYREWRREKTKNTDEIVQKFIDGTKQIKRNQEACMISWVY